MLFRNLQCTRRIYMFRCTGKCVSKTYFKCKNAFQNIGHPNGMHSQMVFVNSLRATMTLLLKAKFKVGFSCCTHESKSRAAMDEQL